MKVEQEAAGVRDTTPAAPAIPHIFHLVWFGGSPPDEYTRFMYRWLDLHPDWRIMLWDESDAVGMQNQELYDAASAIAHLHPNHPRQMRSDILRLEALNEYGGVYLDFDMEPKRSILPLLQDGVQAFVGWEQPQVWVCNAVIGALPGSDFVRELMDGLPARVEAQGTGRRPAQITGPQYVTPVAKRRDEVVIYPKDFFYPYLWNELHRRDEEFPNSYAVHHWNNKRHGG